MWEGDPDWDAPGSALRPHTMPSAHSPARDPATTALLWAAHGLAHAPRVRRALLATLERRACARAEHPPAPLRHPHAVERDRLAMRLALLATLERALAEDRLGDASLRGFVRLLLIDIFGKRGGAAAKARFRAEHGCNPPDFLVLSPGKACNLRCGGCYANAGPAREKLDFATLEHVVREAHDLWGMRFFVLSGGEPLAYRDGGQGVMELAERHPDCFFTMYTNGTLISDAVARRLGRLGNLSPGLSVEGMRERTDARRGAGVFDRVVAAAEALREHKVVFGLSLTATRENCEEVLSPELVELFFGRLGALYAWIFHYMPTGRAPNLELMMTPGQRLRLWERVWRLVREERRFIADFWNSGTASSGCVAAGRPGGYLYVDWNGAVSPCVFIPYSPVNVHDAYARGRTLDDIWAEPFFAALRRWQRAYGYRENGEACPDCRNWLAPCPIRDHHAEFRRILDEHPAAPTADDARSALEDPSYRAGLEAFGRELEALTGPVWRSRYLDRGH